MNRSEELFQYVERFTAVHREWAGDETTNYPPPDDPYWKVFRSMVDGFSNGDLPADCRTLAIKVFELAAEGVRFDATDDVWPSDDFWAARQALEKTWTDLGSPSQPYYIESIVDLDKQKVPHEQIARMWGLKNPDGSGQSWKVAQELRDSGSVIGPDYVHPDHQVALEQAEKAKGVYDTLASQQVQVAEEKAQEEAPCPESSRELFDQQVSVRQAAKMLKRAEPEVLAEWELFRKDDALKESPEESVGGGDDVTDDPYETFADWNYDDLRRHAKGLEIQFKGNVKRTWLIDQILQAEAKLTPEKA